MANIFRKSASILFVLVLIILLNLTLSVAAAPPVTETEINYQLEWDWQGVERHPEGGWVTTNNLGYTVHVQDGLINTVGVTLIPCPDEQVVLPQNWFVEWFGASGALAGHKPEGADQSYLEGMIMEGLRSPQDLTLTVAPISATTYCSGHYAFGPEAIFRDGPQVTLQIVGTYTASGASDLVPFAVDSDLAWGTLFDIEPLITSDQPVQVTAIRSLSGMFADIDFLDLSPEESEKAFLRSLTDSLAVEIIVDDIRR
jgi:hypothetical protein